MVPPPEFQAVILAAGTGSRFMDLTSQKAKCLLPIGNHPMIWYPMTMLNKIGFQEIIVICWEQNKSEICSIPKKFGLTDLRIDAIALNKNDHDDFGTADALRMAHDKLRSPRVLVVSSDLITDLQMHNLTDLHRVHGSSVTALFTSMELDKKNIPVPGPKTKPKKERDLVGLDPKTKQLCYLCSMADLEDVVSVRKCLMLEHPQMNIHSNLTDAHCYIIERWVLDFLKNEKYISSIKGELIPYLVKKQFSKEKVNQTISEEEPPNPKSQSTDQQDLLSFQPIEKLSQDAQMLSNWNDHSGDLSGAYHQRQLRCYAYVMDTGICIRANNLYAYCELNRMAGRLMAVFEKGSNQGEYIHPNSQVQPKAQIGSECFVGSGTFVADKTTTKMSLIGHNCKVEEKVKVTNSILMDNVTIKEGCQISGSLLCDGSVVQEGSVIKDCIVGKGFKFANGEKHSNEVLMDQKHHMMEI